MGRALTPQIILLNRYCDSNMSRPDRFTSWLESIQISKTDAEYAVSRMRELPSEQTRGFPFWFILKMIHPAAGGPVVRSKEKMKALLDRWNGKA
jgi:hypothetical protein